MSAPIFVTDTITKLPTDIKGSVVIAASHGGLYVGYLAAKARVRGVILSDASVGLDGAGIASLDYLDKLRVPAATVGADTARIGDGADLETRGIISYVNLNAGALGCAVGSTVRECATAMQAAPIALYDAPQYAEARTLFKEDRGAQIWGIDSISLVRDEDAGQIVISASHGGALASQPQSAAGGIAVFAALFNDAGIGIDEAGISRLRVLEKLKIAAATVDAGTARIGDARSSWATGRISRMNAIAQRLGGELGLDVPTFVERLIDSRNKRFEAIG